ncbi:MAG: hypothetical protein JNL42_04840 [Anaerolineae bacterium]|nr:hypothetical protein [Anaerolineae bacterium]
MATSTVRYEDLPLWMQRAMRKTDWGVLIVLGFCIIGALPQLLSSSVPIGTNHERYVFRAAEVAQSIREGRLYPRWTDEALGGYGAPIPHYLPPLTGFLPALIDLTLLNDPAAAVSASFVIANCIAGVSLYALITRKAGSVAATCAAILYVFNPMIAVTVPLRLGDLTLALGAALLPCLLWALDCLCQRRSAVDFSAVVLSSAALILLDARFAAAGFCAGLLLIFLNISRHQKIPALLVTSAAALGMGIASFYWLPALVESSAVRWYPPDIAPTYLVHWQSLFSTPLAADPNVLNNLPEFTLGFTPLLVLPIALLALRRREAERRLYGLALLAALALASASLISGGSYWFLIPSTLCFAIAGASVAALSTDLPKLLKHILPVALCSVAIAGALQPLLAAAAPLNAPTGLRDFSSQAALSFEQRGYGTAILSIGAALPATISSDYIVSSESLSNQLNSAGSKTTILSGRAQIGLISSSAHDLRLQVESFTPLSLEMLTAAFPGWTARFSGTEIALRSPSESHLLALDLPRGARGELWLTLDSTLPRLIAWLATWTAVITSVFITLRWKGVDSAVIRGPNLLTAFEARFFTILLFAVACVLLLVRVFPEAAKGISARAADSSIGREQATSIRSDSGLELTAYDLETTAVQSGSSLDLTLYWRTLRPLDVNYRTQIAFQDRSSGRIDTLTSTRHPGDLPTTRWQPRRTVIDRWRISIPNSLSPGNYDLVLAVFSCDFGCETRQSLTFFTLDGTLVGQLYALPSEITIISG